MMKMLLGNTVVDVLEVSGAQLIILPALQVRR